MKASVVVPTFNAGPGFGALLAGLFSQETGFDYEVMVIDSGSTDGTPELARRCGASVHRARQDEFDHGGTRNLAASLAAGEEYVAFVVQDAVPLDGRWLATMVENMERDPQVAGVYGRQVPRPGSGPLARVLVEGSATAGTERREQAAADPGLYRTLPPAEKRALALFDNVGSCVRRSVWERVPFERGGFGEDLRWGKSVVEKGHKLVYEPRSAVVHSHERGALYDLRRHYAEGRVLLDLFGLAVVPNLPALLVGALRSSAYLYLRMTRDEKAKEGRLHLALLAAGHALSSRAGLYLGAKSRRLAAKNPGLAARLERLLGTGV